MWDVSSVHGCMAVCVSVGSRLTSQNDWWDAGSSREWKAGRQRANERGHTPEAREQSGCGRVRESERDTMHPQTQTNPPTLGCHYWSRGAVECKWHSQDHSNFYPKIMKSGFKLTTSLCLYFSLLPRLQVVYIPLLAEVNWLAQRLQVLSSRKCDKKLLFFRLCSSRTIDPFWIIVRFTDTAEQQG